MYGSLRGEEGLFRVQARIAFAKMRLNRTLMEWSIELSIIASQAGGNFADCQPTNQPTELPTLLLTHNFSAVLVLMPDLTHKDL